MSDVSEASQVRRSDRRNYTRDSTSERTDLRRLPSTEPTCSDRVLRRGIRPGSRHNVSSDSNGYPQSGQCQEMPVLLGFLRTGVSIRANRFYPISTRPVEDPVEEWVEASNCLGPAICEVDTFRVWPCKHPPVGRISPPESPPTEPRSRRGLGNPNPRPSGYLSKPRTSAAARSPDLTAPSMYPVHSVAVSVPAQWMGPTGAVSAGP